MQNIYAIKDKSMGFYEVFMESNDYGALRRMSDITNRENTFHNAHSEDLDLYKLSSINTDSGEMTNELKFIENLANLKKN